MAHPYYQQQQGGRGGPGPGGYTGSMNMRGHGIGSGGHPMGMMGQQGGGMMGQQGGGMMGQQGGGMNDPRMRRDPMVMGRGYDYDRGDFDNMGGQSMGGGPIRHGVPVPGSSPRMVSPAERQPQNMMDDSRASSRTPASANPPPPTATPNKNGPDAVRYANDCEIIVTAKAQQSYAEMIEKAIRDFELKVDLMFPKPDVKLNGFIDNIAAMGTIFAVVIRPDNEAHRSVSVHVLRGPPKPEEHRNMPLTAAYQLIKDRYRDLKRKEVGVVPENMKLILKFLMEEKKLTDLEYTTVIKFLQERRRKQNAFEKRTNNIVGVAPVTDIFDCPEAKELQQRIIGFLNGENGGKKLVSKSPDGERIGDLVVPRPKEPLGVLETDPTVQNALNNLMNPAFLSALNSATGGGPSSNQQPAGRGGGFGRGQGFGRGGY